MSSLAHETAKITQTAALASLLKTSESGQYLQKVFPGQVVSSFNEEGDPITRISGPRHEGNLAIVFDQKEITRPIEIRYAIPVYDDHTQIGEREVSVTSSCVHMHTKVDRKVGEANHLNTEGYWTIRKEDDGSHRIDAALPYVYSSGVATHDDF
ncbi:hypothetical protein COY90_02640 [Candidatus Roizmanbacteria bacterium CG_4_10_14_0_8_um_filter_39_9]|uniref:Uncharacterized protein n=1 Tax=Candidatus Roizmanbacteria bacterium CG_4_10_14_0_8_um_filter_39_9 TaxID=1974829 RepID=A0A2M7QE93_9BACT|nr:MAG: hypothetical protein COY90_02640 [Candidatus Roizmanbacteria bacterium CG_4_10_14_0_8_um_filter_39_9]